MANNSQVDRVTPPDNPAQSLDDDVNSLLLLMTGLCGDRDGTLKFPNSAEGDILKIAHALLARRRGTRVTAPAPSAWTTWSSERLAKEILARMHHFFAQTDGSMAFPSTPVGKVLKVLHTFLTSLDGADPRSWLN